MATYGSLNLLAGTWSSHQIFVDFYWERTSYDEFANTSTYFFSIDLRSVKGATWRGDEEINWTIGGVAFKHTANCELDTDQTKRIYNGNVTLGHATDGTIGAVRFNLWGNIIGANWTNTVDPSDSFNGPWSAVEGYFYPDRIPRPATLTGATDFTDEGNPTITYSNPGGNYVTTLRAAISLDGKYPLIEYKDVPKTGNTFVYPLTDAERATLRKKTTGTSRTFYIMLVCTDSGHNYIGSLVRTMTLVNHEPTLSPSVVDTDTRILALTGKNTKFVKGYSDAQFTINADPKKEATIDYQWIRCGSVTLDDYTSNTGTINDIDSNTVYFEMKNSRGLVVRTAKVLDMIPYFKLTSSLETSLFKATGEVTFTLKGKFFDGDFGKEYNTMQVQYSLQDEDGNFAQVDGVRESGWVELGVVTPDVNNTNYTFSHTITGLDYEKTWKLTVAVHDALTPLQVNDIVVAPLPIFDWSGTDFHHHTDLRLTGGAKLYFNDNHMEDFVIEEMSNGTWFYRKWNNGRVELHGYQNIEGVACNTGLGNWYRTAVIYGPSFPISVINPKCVSSYESDGYGAMIWNTTTTTESDPPNYYLIRPTTSGAIFGVVNFYVTGTWK